MPFKSVGDELSKFKAGQLHSGSKAGPLVTNRKQAVAIALSEQRKKEGTPGLGAARYQLASIRRDAMPRKKAK